MFWVYLPANHLQLFSFFLCCDCNIIHVSDTYDGSIGKTHGRSVSGQDCGRIASDPLGSGSSALQWRVRTTVEGDIELRGRITVDLQIFIFRDNNDSFLIELLSCFFTESCPRLHTMLAAALAYRDGKVQYNSKSIEVAIRESAHALKGSASNVMLMRIFKVCH